MRRLYIVFAMLTLAVLCRAEPVTTDAETSVIARLQPTEPDTIENPYENYKRKPINWMVFNIIGSVVMITAKEKTQLQGGAVLFGVTAPLTIVKFVKHYKYEAWEAEHSTEDPS